MKYRNFKLPQKNWKILLDRSHYLFPLFISEDTVRAYVQVFLRLCARYREKSPPCFSPSRTGIRKKQQKIRFNLSLTNRHKRILSFFFFRFPQDYVNNTYHPFIITRVKGEVNGTLSTYTWSLLLTMNITEWHFFNFFYGV
jgi:hypothetical protein